MRALSAVVAAVLLAGCSSAPPLPSTPVSRTTLPLPAGAQLVDADPGEAAEACDATASLRPAAPEGPTIDAIRARGRLIAGVDQSTNLFSFRDPSSGELQGFDIDIAREVAREVLGDPNKVDFRLIAEPDRITAVENGEIDILVKATTITCPRAERIAFSSVYFTAQQRLLVPQGSGIEGPEDLADRVVCSGLDTTSMATVARVAPDAKLLGVRNWDDCLVALQQGQADAVSTDDSILAGMAAQDPNLEIVGPSLEAEPYGIGVNKSQEDLVRAVNASLERIRADGTWMRFYDRWLSVLGPLAAPPAAKYRD